MNDMIDALAMSMGINVVESPFIEPGKAFLFREPMPMKFEIPKPVFEYERDFTLITLCSCFHVPVPAGIIIGCDFGSDDRTVVRKVRKWCWKYRGPRRRSRRIQPTPTDQRAGASLVQAKTAVGCEPSNGEKA